MREYLSLERNELRILLVFVLLFTLFIHWGGVNAYSRYDLTRAVVEDQSLEIGDYSHNTVDKVAFGFDADDYVNTTDFSRANVSVKTEMKKQALERIFEDPDVRVYSDKAPMSSFIAVPGYVLGDFISGFLAGDASRWSDERFHSRPVSLSTETAVKQFFVVLTVSVLFGVLLLLLFYRYLREEVGEDVALYTVLVAGTATFFFVYSTSLWGVINAAFFGFASFLSIERYLDSGDARLIYAAGILSALAFSTEYYAALVPLGLVIYLASLEDWLGIGRFVAGSIVGAIPLLAYHWAVTGNPFLPPLMGGAAPVAYRAGCWIHAACHPNAVSIFVLDPGYLVNVLLRLLFFPSRGLFFYAPVLLLAIPGIYEIYRKNRKMLIVFPGIFVLFLLFNALLLNWLAGLSFGPRYLVVGLPFLLLPLSLGIRKLLDYGQEGGVILVLLVTVSVFHILLGFNSLPEIGMDTSTYETGMSSPGPVYDMYPDLRESFSRYGPRSEVLMSFTGREKGFDITYRNPYGPEYLKIIGGSSRFVLLETKWLPVILLIWIMSLMFISLEERGKSENRRNMAVLGGATAVLLSLSIAFSPVMYGDGFYSHNVERDSRWMSEEGNLKFYAEGGETIYFEAGLSEVMNESSLEVSLNGERLEEFEIKGSQPIYLPNASVEEGRNTLGLNSTEGCVMSDGRGDVRCLSFLLRNFTLMSAEETPDAIFYRGWYPLGAEEMSRWMDEDAEILFKSPRDGLVFLEVGPHSSSAERRLKISINGREKRNFWIRGRQQIVMYEDIVPGWNRMELEVPEGCVETEGGCYSFLLTDFTVSRWEDDFSRFGRGELLQNWYRQERVQGDRVRWMSDNATLLIESPAKRNMILEGEIQVFNATERTLEIAHLTNDGTTEYTVSVPSSIYLNRSFELEEGANLFRFDARPGCKDTENERCLSLMFRNFLFGDIYVYP